MIRPLHGAAILGSWIWIAYCSPASGLDTSTAPSSSVGTGNATEITTGPSSNATAPSTSTNGPVTGSGSSFASSCQQALWSWKLASESYGSAHQIPTTITSNNVAYETDGLVWTFTNYTGGVSATSSTTLCDGYPRAIGSASYLHSTPTTLVSTDYYITTSGPGPYPTPSPCSIGASDCADLWASFNAFTSASLVFQTSSFLEPPCATTGTSVSFGTAECGDWHTPANNGVFASSVQLLYWPVRTAANASSPFCHGDMPQTIPGTPTGQGPNTFVTGSLTITSPTVALSYSGLARGDGCGTTIDHTILTLRPEQLTSVRGARAAFDYRPFNFADLNWMCEGPNGTFVVQDMEVDPNRCYQDVQAAAYWDTNPQHDWQPASDQKESGTILNNYRPYVIPASTLFTDFLSDYWGPTAMWWIDGAWDPPIAMTQVSSAAQPTLPHVSAETTSVSYYAPSPIRLSSVISGYGPTLPHVPTRTSMSSDGIPPYSSMESSSLSFASGAIPDEQPSSTPGYGASPPGQSLETASPESSSTVNIGGIIASALGMTSKLGSSGSASAPPVEQPPHVVVINGQRTTVAPQVPALTINGNTITAGSGGGYVIDSSSLEPGSAMTVSGTTYSLGPDGASIVIDGQTSSIYTQVGSMSVNSDGGLVIGTQTIGPGSALTISGTTYSVSVAEVRTTSAGSLPSSDATSSHAESETSASTGAVESSSVAASQNAANGRNNDLARPFLIIVMCAAIIRL